MERNSIMYAPWFVCEINRSPCSCSQKASLSHFEIIHLIVVFLMVSAKILDYPQTKMFDGRCQEWIVRGHVRYNVHRRVFHRVKINGEGHDALFILWNSGTIRIKDTETEGSVGRLMSKAIEVTIPENRVWGNRW